MLNDVFVRRYANCEIWSAYSELERCLLYQVFVITQQLLSSYNHDGDGKWQLIHDQLAIELGVSKLFDLDYQSYDGINDTFYNESISWEDATESFFTELCATDKNINPDYFIKKRLSFVELAMRLKQQDINKMPIDTTKESAKIEFRQLVDELNERFRQAKANLIYGNDLIYLSKDPTIDEKIGKLFWDLVSDPIWKNVEKEIQKAIDSRDNNPQDRQEEVVFHASKAMESALKIIAKKNGCNKKFSATKYAEHLHSTVCNDYDLDGWELEILKCYFKHVRNPASHPSNLKINDHQANWIIHNAMAWIISLVRRMH